MPDMTIAQAVLLFVAGLGAGFVNAVAGGGSAITLPILTEMLDASIANGTNRVAILIANITASASYGKGGAVPWKAVRPLVVPAVLGSAAGAWVASLVSPDSMKRVFSVVLILVAASVALKPARWVQNRQAVLGEPWRSVVFFAIGFYGGFVQAGVGFLLLAGLVLGGGLDLVRANAAKVVIIASYTIVALVIFFGAAQVNLGVGLVLAAGNSTGAYVSSRIAMQRGAGWVRWILVVAAIAAAIRMAFL